jgi:DnaJ-class molecular chaperone
VLLAAGYILLLYAKPTRRCSRCHGERVTIRRTWLRGRVRTRRCRRCSGTGRSRRLGATFLHRLIQSVKAERNRP